MHGARSFRRFTAWLAMWVLALQALLPVAAQAVVHAAGRADWQEVCTATGMVRVKWTSADADTAGKSAPSADMGQSCPVCTLHGTVLGLPPSPLGLAQVPVLADHPPAFDQAAHTAAVWLTAHARAPPSGV